MARSSLPLFYNARFAQLLYSFGLATNFQQDPDAGGFADRPGNMVDVYHTHFGLAGLSLLGYPGLHEVDAV